MGFLRGSLPPKQRLEVLQNEVRIRSKNAQKLKNGEKQEGGFRSGKTSPLDLGESMIFNFTTEERKKFDGRRKNVNRATSISNLPEVSGMMKKRNRWGRWQDRYICVHDYCLLYSTNKESLVKGHKVLQEAINQLYATGLSRARGSDITVIPLEVIDVVTFNKAKVIFKMKKEWKKKEIVFRVSSGNPYESVQFCNGVKSHLDFYNSQTSKLSQ
ncbi:hypothetical protein AAMO2058_000674300 [Amorphochlora amoebiformis]